MPPLAAGEIIREMGWVALFTRGLPLRIVMIGTLTGLQWGEWSEKGRAAVQLCHCCRPDRALHQAPLHARGCLSWADIGRPLHRKSSQMRSSLMGPWPLPPPPSAGIYDAFKVYVGLPTTGSAEPAKTAEPAQK